MYQPLSSGSTLANSNSGTIGGLKKSGLKKVASALLLDPHVDLPAGASPYEDFDFQPYFQEEQDEEELRKTWRVFTKVKDVLDNGLRLENASWRLWYRERLRMGEDSGESGAESVGAEGPRVGEALEFGAFELAMKMKEKGKGKRKMPAAAIPLPGRSLRASSKGSVGVELNRMETMITQDETAPIPAGGALRTGADAGTSMGLGLHKAVGGSVGVEMDRLGMENKLIGKTSSHGDRLPIHKNKVRAPGAGAAATVGGRALFGRVDTIRLDQETKRLDDRDKVERASRLQSVVQKHGLDEQAVNDVLTWVHRTILQAPEIQATCDFELLPRTVQEISAFLKSSTVAPRKRVAAFGHSLERNGANNFLLYLVRELKEDLSFDIYSPKEGPMRADYESMNMPVSILDSKTSTYPAEVRKTLRDYDFAIANTIMTTEIINASKELSLPSLWVIHEAWPKDEMDYYAKEVFLMPHLDKYSILAAFTNASKIVFPARVQRRCYDGLFEQEKARVIYNGIPLTAINTYRTVQSRNAVRKDLGYSRNDIVLVQMGTVCKRKAQLVTARAFCKLCREYDPDLADRLRLLMVGARYIRQHEIAYIDRIKACIEDAEVDHQVSILDVKKNVLPYYLAADIILCPSINEVLPLVICEAMAFERPVIATRIDGIPEAVTDGVEGLLIEPGSTEALAYAIDILIKDPELRHRMGAAGRNRVLSQFSFKTMAKYYRDAISETLPKLDRPAAVTEVVV